MKGLVFVYLLAYGGAIFALFRPYVGFLVYVILSIIRPESMWNWAINEGNFSRVVGVALLIGWVFNGLGNWRLGRARGIVASMFGYWAWMILSAFSAVDQENAWELVDLTGKVVVPCLAGITLIDSVAKLKQLIWTIVLSQAYVAMDFNQSYFSGYNKLCLDGFGGMDNNCNAIALVTCLGPALLLGLEDRIWWRKGLVAVSALLMVHAILFSNSRGGMVAAIIAGLMTFALMPKRPQNLAAFALATVLCLGFAGQGVRERFMMIFASKEDRDDSAQSRLDLWAGCWDAMQKRPIIGAGPRNWPRLAKYDYGWETGKEAHNLWLQTGAETGFPGLGLLVAFYGLTIARLLPMARERFPAPEPWFHEGARMVIVSIVGFAVSATFVSLQTLETPFYIAIMGAGLLKLSSASAHPSPKRPSPPLVARS